MRNTTITFNGSADLPGFTCIIYYYNILSPMSYGLIAANVKDIMQSLIYIGIWNVNINVNQYRFLVESTKIDNASFPCKTAISEAWFIQENGDYKMDLSQRTKFCQ